MASFSGYNPQSHSPSPRRHPMPNPQAPSSSQPHYSQPPHWHGSSYGHSSFPPGTHPDVIRSFQMVDRDRSGYIDEIELQQALSSGYQRFSLRTIRLLMFSLRIPALLWGLNFRFLCSVFSGTKQGPNEFAALWSCLGQWRAIFERFDRDRSGKIDSMELKDALYSFGYAVRLLFSRCGMIVKGLTEKFKEKDPRYTGSATLTYDAFLSMIIPFLVA
ncbi:putative calcium-binding protein CML48 [Vitis vinifera]|uniref:Putative calcium-binding protein CML48 n=1 Tax=Vitis vinifera TaxID=29760 RepID=A0A438HRH2_VITVI|nr:putative calcium-binding protein CML48 [Vitis vinifera]